MSTPSPPPPTLGPALSAEQSTALLASFTTFLTLAIHSLLFHRDLYPRSTFLLARAFNLPVQQSRHPRVCAWVADAVAAVAAQLREGRVRRVALAVHRAADKSFDVLERWVFDVEAFPAFGADVEADRDDDAGVDEGNDAEAAPEEDELVNWADVHEALRGALRRIAHAGETLPPLPKGCTFTLAVELRDDAPAPIGHPQAWIPAQPNLQPPTKSQPNQGQSLGGASTMPVRAVQAGPMFFECFVEQGKGTETDGEAKTSPASKT